MKIKRLLLFFWILCISSLNALEERPFVVLITASNNKSYFEKNLDSVLSQNYTNYRILYVLDGSTDETYPLLEKALEQSPHAPIKIYQHKEKRGHLASVCQAVFSCKKEEIIVELDGTDWLSHRDVLSYLNQIYSDP
ncbi:MAG: glycosyltransferase family 2 protein, partial [Chlamydiales bacterium]|nr:glycosyltransferase family 2 protein [Chlamydiales bacterium]